MTLDEASKLLSIGVTVDGGCSTCVSGFVHDLREVFPEVDWRAAAESAVLADGGYIDRDTLRGYTTDAIDDAW